MRQRIRAYASIALFVLFCIAPIHSSAQDWRRDADRLFRQYARESSPGCALVVVKDGEVIYQKGYGMANLRYGIPIDPETTIFRTASNSKQFTAFCILLLYDEGLLSLDDDIHDYIPEVPDFGETITLRHLIHHTSGLRDYLSLASMSGLYLMNDLIYKEHGLAWVERQQALNFTPGDQFMYSNTGYLLLGEVVARVSGQTLPEFAKERIFDPLGMTNTRFIDNYQEVIENFADAYAPGPDGKPWHMPMGFSSVGAAGLASTAIDLAKWDENFYHPIVGNETIIDLMQQRMKLNDGSEGPMSMGLIVDDSTPLKVVY
ncbi:beta-lactamase family protein, partial [bacterium]|nr:beta-lactamase family protein [bacterium]